MKEKNHINFNTKIVNSISTEENRFLMIKNLVFTCCLDSGFMSAMDKNNKTSKYLWYEEVFMRNYYSLNLLETVMENKFNPSLPEDVDRDVKYKASAIIKDIARRLISEPTINTVSGSDFDFFFSQNLSKSVNKIRP